MKNIKIIKKNAFLLLVVLAIILYFILKDDFSNIVKALISVDLKWIFLVIVFMVIYWILRAISLFIITKEYSKQIKFKRILAITLITQFFNGITPFSTGGQPMEVYYLSRSGIKVSKGTNIIIQNFIFYQTALILHGILAIGLNCKFHFFKEVPFLKELTLIGFLVNTLVGLGLLFISFSTKFNKMIINVLIWFAHKIKLVKDRDESMHKWQNRLDDFHDSGMLLIKNKKILGQGIIYNFVALMILYSIPLFVFYSMGNFDINIVEAITASAYVLIIGAFVPIPGGSGGIEFGFMQFFGNFVTGPLLSATLLIWRFITYYLGIIIGAITINFLKEM